MTATSTSLRQRPQGSRLRAHVALAWLAVAMTAACKPEIPKAKTTSTSSASSDDATEVVEETQEKPYAYSPVGKRDPFRDPTKNLATKQEGPQGGGPLQKFDLDQLRLAFTTTASSSPMALVVDPNGQGHIVQIGDFVGKNWGKVSAIKREEVTVTELITDPIKGTAFPQFLPIRMPKSDADRQAEATLQLVWAADNGKSDQKSDAPASRVGETHDAHQN